MKQERQLSGNHFPAKQMCQFRRRLSPTQYYFLVTLRYSLNWSSLTLGSLSQSRRSQPQSRRMVRAEANWSDKFACLVDNLDNLDMHFGTFWYFFCTWLGGLGGWRQTQDLCPPPSDPGGWLGRIRINFIEIAVKRGYLCK